MRSTKRIAAVLILSLCVAFTPACDKDRIREAAKASDRMATLIGSAIDLKRQLAEIGSITPQEEKALTISLLEANTRVKQFNEFARKQTEDTPQTRLDLAEAFNGVTVAINKLSNEAIFPIKNAESKKKLLAILNSLNASIAIIDVALKG